MINSHPYFHKDVLIIILIGFVSLLAIELLSIESQQSDIIKQSLAQLPISKNNPIVDGNLEEKQRKSKLIEAVGHFANNQIKDGIVTWIQGGFWELRINNITNINNVSKNNTLINNNNNNASFIANFTMIRPDGSFSHNHNIENFTATKVIIADKDIVVIGIADVYFDDDYNNNNYKNVPLTIHLMGKKVLGLTIDVSKTERHFSSPNEIFGTIISGVGLDRSATVNSTHTMIHPDTVTNITVAEESMETMMQH